MIFLIIIYGIMNYIVIYILGVNFKIGVMISFINFVIRLKCWVLVFFFNDVCI